MKQLTIIICVFFVCESFVLNTVVNRMAERSVLRMQMDFTREMKDGDRMSHNPKI